MGETAIERNAQGKPDIYVDYGYDEEGRGLLEERRYGYDELGNRTSIRKKRAGLPLESGEYEYAYDGLHRLIQVAKDGQPLRSYAYDAFGNRIRMEDRERGRVSAYHYNAMNQLIREEIHPLGAVEDMPGMSEERLPARGEGFFKEYAYDRRGNLVQESRHEGSYPGANGEREPEGKLLHGYVYDAGNRLERAWNDKGEEAIYLYNGMGQRVEKRSGAEQEEYLLDLTKPYHNLLGIQREKETESFYWDFTPIATQKKGSSPRYYLSDEYEAFKQYNDTQECEV